MNTAVEELLPFIDDVFPQVGCVLRMRVAEVHEYGGAGRRSLDYQQKQRANHL